MTNTIGETRPCKGCGQPITWVLLNGKPHPADAKPIMIIYEGKLISGHISHFATCPRADEFRKQKRMNHGQEK